MDPEATMNHVCRSVQNESYEEAALYLADYLAWRLKGGFEPPDGDEWALALVKSFGRVMDASKQFIQ